MLARLKKAGLRPTRQRLALGRLLFEGGDRHVTAETLHKEATVAGVRVALATVYNTLHQFTEAGLLREVVAAPGRAYFDTNLSDHHHFYEPASDSLVDVPAGAVRLAHMPAPPKGARIERVDVVFRLRRSNASD